MFPVDRPRIALIACSAALVVYLIANAIELLLVRNGTNPAVIVWLSDLIPAAAFGFAAALWLDLRATRVARSAAEAASRAKDDALAIVAHELRNPLAAITAGFQVLERAPTEKDRARARQVILVQATHLSRMVEDLLDAGRAANGKISLERTRMDLAAALYRAVDTLRHAGKLEQHRVTIGAESVWVHADALRIEQIVVNLLSNAIKYTPEGGSIHVSVVADADAAVMRVQDTGIGIPPELLPGVFGLFVQGNHPSPEGSQGLGIGLSLVRRLVELHGGTVRAWSAGRDRGTTIEVRLPRIASPVTASFRDATVQRGVERTLT